MLLHETEVLRHDHLRFQQKLVFTIGISLLETNHRPVGSDRMKPRSLEDVGGGRLEQDLRSLKGDIAYRFAARNIANTDGKIDRQDDNGAGAARHRSIGHVIQDRLLVTMLLHETEALRHGHLRRQQKLMLTIGGRMEQDLRERPQRCRRPSARCRERGKSRDEQHATFSGDEYETTFSLARQEMVSSKLLSLEMCMKLLSPSHSRKTGDEHKATFPGGKHKATLSLSCSQDKR